MLLSSPTAGMKTQAHHDIFSDLGYTTFMREGSNESKWLPVVGCEGFYEVSDHGAVRSVGRIVRSDAMPGGSRLSSGRILKPWKDGKGYETVSLSVGGKVKKQRVHRLVGRAFIGEAPLSRPYMNHKNGIKTDNRVENLEYCSMAENNLHAARSGLRTKTVGENHRWAKLTQAKAMEIFNASGGVCEIARRYGLQHQHVSDIKRKKTWAKMHELSSNP